jgi:uncharacterized protein YbbK (DUF523 family)
MGGDSGHARSSMSSRPGRPRVGISRCLLGDEVRYDGGHKRDSQLLDALGPYVEWVPVCPEVEVGMGTPREPIHLVEAAEGVASGRFRVRLLGVESGRDWTAAMDGWRQSRVRELREARLAGFVLKLGSPSCGVADVRVASMAGPDAAGRGLFAHALLEAIPGLPVEEESRLHDRRACEAFLARVRSYHRDVWLATDG